MTGWRPDDHGEPSVFRPEHLLREARRQLGRPDQPVPAICALDPDGDLIRFLETTGRGRLNAAWACYHTEMLEFRLVDGRVIGVVGRAVGAPFAVLVAEQLFASGCRTLLSITSAGRIGALDNVAEMILIDRALRDDGTSAHYLPSDAPAFVPAPDPALLDRVEVAVRQSGAFVRRGAAWTTDAPYRETESAIEAARVLGVAAVEMEAAALYAFAARSGVSVVCFAHVTNTMGQVGGDDFEKGEAQGAVGALRLIEAAALACEMVEGGSASSATLPLAPPASA